MSNDFLYPLFRTFIVATLVFGGLLAGCADTRKIKLQLAELSQQNTTLQETQQRLSSELAEQKNSTARLQMQLIEKQAELERLSRKQDLAPVTEPESLQGRIPPPNSKAEAVSCLAEAEIEINAIGRLEADGQKPQDFSQVHDLLIRSRSALDRDDYQESCSLATQALTMRRKNHLQAALSQKTKISPYASFLEPLTLQTTKRSNLRSLPGTRSRILATLDAVSPVYASGYRGNWIKVTDSTGRTGWIHHSLLAVPPSGDQIGQEATGTAAPLPGNSTTIAEP